ncbi:MAG: branched-chain amino acid ABC transporter permease [Alphaproteobacteria bacterium]
MRFLFKTEYRQDLRLFKHNGQRFWYAALALLLIAAPFVISEYYLLQLEYIIVYSIVGLGLMLLAGFTGQVSIGHAAFLAVGAYTEAILGNAGWPFPLSLLAALLVTALVGVIIGLPALRVRGIYLGIATIAFNFIVEEVIARFTSVTGGNNGLTVKPASVFGWQMSSKVEFYFVALAILVLITILLLNLLRSPTGRAFIAIRDSEISAQSMGINLAYYKTLSFAVSAGITGLAGALYAHLVGFLTPEQFTIIQSIELLILIIIGGIGSIHGAFFGAFFYIALLAGISNGKDLLPQWLQQQTGLQPTIFGVVLVAFVLFEPLGLYGRWLKIRTYFDLLPFYRKSMYRRQKAFLKSERLR